MKNNTNEIIQKAISREDTITYDISHFERNHAKGAWKFARTCNADFNVHLSFDFKADLRATSTDVRRVRDVCHRIRMFLRTNGNIPSNIMWTRFVPLGSDREYVNILAHIPANEIVHFEQIVQGWNLGINVKPATYIDDQSFRGKPCSIFDLMFRAVSNETLHKDPGVVAEKSEPLVGPRYFCSRKLWIRARKLHRQQNASKTIVVAAV